MVQAAHAAIEAAHFLIPKDEEHPHLVVCGVKTEQELLAVQNRLSGLGINLKVFREPDRGGEATAICTEPIAEDQKKLLRRYQCLKPPVEDSSSSG